MRQCLLSLGSNIGNRAAAIRAALLQLGSLDGIGRIRRVSNLYDTTPQYVTTQPRFLNAVCEIDTALEPAQLLATIKMVETNLGRPKDGIADPTTRFGPRTIDIDILAYYLDRSTFSTEKADVEWRQNEVIMQTEKLTLPHPRVAERGFVLQPLSDICPERIWH
eukprot:SAG31_NODE_6010_length_2216_cov_1.300425_1_plen_163_part_10